MAGRKLADVLSCIFVRCPITLHPLTGPKVTGVALGIDHEHCHPSTARIIYRTFEVYMCRET